MNDDLWNTQATLIFAAVVAGKSEGFARKVVGRLLEGDRLPFQTIHGLISDDRLDAALRLVRSGSYTRLGRCLPELIKLNPTTCTVEELEAVPGVGPKTARAFLLWTRPDSRYAALDTHILKYLRFLGYAAPKSTPTGRKYQDLEIAFIQQAEVLGMTPAALDSQVWEHYAKGAPALPR